MKKGFLMLVFLVFVFRVNAQEFNCKVQINTQQVQGFDRSVVKSMESAISDFMNNRKWTAYQFKPEERIECTLLFTVTQIVSSDEFKGSFSIVLQRPVFNSNYRSSLLNLIDKNVQFHYAPSQSMNYVENSFSNNLTSLLAFYAYMMLGVDFDSFADHGGSLYYQQAMSVVQTAQTSGYVGWQSHESDKNRFHFVEGLQNKAYDGLRVFLYQYHRLGLDTMTDDVVQARSKILASLDQLKLVHQKRPGLYDLQLLLDAKRPEIVNIFSKANPVEKNKLMGLMSQIDPAHGDKIRQELNVR